MEIKYQNLRVLGPAILKVKIPDEILDKLNDYIDKIINDDSKLKKLNYGEALVCDVTPVSYTHLTLPTILSV